MNAMMNVPTAETIAPSTTADVVKSPVMRVMAVQMTPAIKPAMALLISWPRTSMSPHTLGSSLVTILHERVPQWQIYWSDSYSAITALTYAAAGG
jgi:hypothetical protein